MRIAVPAIQPIFTDPGMKNPPVTVYDHYGMKLDWIAPAVDCCLLLARLGYATPPCAG